MMEFSPENKIVQQCIQGMALAANDQQEAARLCFEQTWDEAMVNWEKFLAAYFIARVQDDAIVKLSWLKTALHHAVLEHDLATKSACPAIYTDMAKCCVELDRHDEASQYEQLIAAAETSPADPGPFFHGTKADLHIGDLLIPGGYSNYQADLKMNHIYFTALVNGAGLAASLAKGEGQERVYIVIPTGDFEHDPNLTDKKFPGNLTRSYRSASPLKIIGEITDWKKQTARSIQQWKNKLADNTGEIIN